MQNNTRWLACVLGMLSLTGAARAADAVTPPKPEADVTRLSDTLGRIEAETMVLKARERQLGVQVAIIAKQNEIAARQEDTERAAKAQVGSNPVVHSIEGIGANQYATLELDNGSMADVRVGDTLSNGMRVVAVQGGGVTVQTAAKQRIRLKAAVNTPAPFDPSLPSSGVSLPRSFLGVKGGEK
jgi:type IV pilus biogenesis protein PilP